MLLIKMDHTSKIEMLWLFLVALQAALLYKAQIPMGNRNLKNNGQITSRQNHVVAPAENTLLTHASGWY